MAIHPVSKEHYTAGLNIETMLQYFGAIKIIFADDSIPICQYGPKAATIPTRSNGTLIYETTRFT